ncbi:MAG: hypothetical protein ACJ73S_16435, partial [Mycobacteriales bacterium]
ADAYTRSAATRTITTSGIAMTTVCRRRIDQSPNLGRPRRKGHRHDRARDVVFAEDWGVRTRERVPVCCISTFLQPAGSALLRTETYRS